MDLWEINEKELKKRAKELPESILKEQAELLWEKTGQVIRGRISNMKVQSEEIPYALAVSFDLVVPSLDFYSCTLMNVYSRPEDDYPVAITVGQDVFTDGESFSPRFECNDKEDFVRALKEILSSDEVNDKIQMLYSKATIENA